MITSRARAKFGLVCLLRNNNVTCCEKNEKMAAVIEVSNAAEHEDDAKRTNLKISKTTWANHYKMKLLPRRIF